MGLMNSKASRLGWVTSRIHPPVDAFGNRRLHFPTLDDLHDQLWSVVLSRRDVLDFTKRQHAVDDLAKNHMLSV